MIVKFEPKFKNTTIYWSYTSTGSLGKISTVVAIVHPTTKNQKSTTQKIGIDTAFQVSTKDSVENFCVGKKNGLLPHPESCEKFIECAEGVTYVTSCVSGLHFNAKGKFCDWPVNANCTL